MLTPTWTARALVGPLAACLLGSLALSACSGKDKPAASPTPPVTTTTTPTDTPTPQQTGLPRPVLPTRPAYAQGKKGEIKFARYVVESWGYALASNDVTPLRFAGGGKLCSGCDVLADTLKKRAKEGWSVLPFSIRVHKAVVAANGPKVNVLLTIDLPETQSFFTDGSYRNTSDAHPGASFVVHLTRLKNSYRLDSFTLS